MSENFPELLEQHFLKTNLRPGALIKAQIVDIWSDRVIVNAGLKSEGIIPLSEFRHEEIKIDDWVDVIVVTPEDGFGNTFLSREKARHAKAWITLEEKHKTGELVLGTVIERVKGGFTVEIDSIRAFLPGSLVDMRPVREMVSLEGKEWEFKIIKMDRHRNNVVVSRRAVMEEENSAERKARFESLEEGQAISGIVKNITDYGAFIDLGGIDGLLHITDMAWKRIKHPSQLLSIGDKVRVKILKFERDKKRVSLGMKQLAEDPWNQIEVNYPEGARVKGKITNIADYGCFVEIEEGVEGLVHMSELSWINKNIHPSKLVQVGEEVDVMILYVDKERRRISLGMKQCHGNPWEIFEQTHQIGDKISGIIRSITDFGIFIGLEGDIDGLIHLSDISWSKNNVKAIRKYEKGQEVEAVILMIDSKRERISLSIKRAEADPLMAFIEAHKKDAAVPAEVVEMTSKQATVKLEEGLLMPLRVQHYKPDTINDLTTVLKEGDSLMVKFLIIDEKNHVIHLADEHYKEPTESEASLEKEKKKIITPSKAKSMPVKATLGDLLREKMQQGQEQKKKEDD